MMLMPRRDFDLFGDDFFKDDFFRSEKNNLMKTDIKETEDSYILDIDLPGYKKEDIKVDITDGYLTINMIQIIISIDIIFYSTIIIKSY